MPDKFPHTLSLVCYDSINHTLSLIFNLDHWRSCIRDMPENTAKLEKSWKKAKEGNRYDDERMAFSRRLIAAIKVAGLTIASPVRFARKFNDAHPDKPITIQTVGHWLRGEGIPKEGRTTAIATWLHVPHEWLRYGKGSEPQSTLGVQVENLMPDEILYISKWRKLDSDTRHLIADLIDTFLTARS